MNADDLPNEIWHSIASKLKDLHSVFQLSLCSKRLSQVAQPRLFQLDSRPYRYYALQWAAIHNHTRLVQLSKDLSGSATLNPYRGNEILQLAAGRGHAQVVDSLLTLFDVEPLLRDDYQPIAALYGTDPMLDGPEEGNTLETAIFSGQPEVVKVLLRHGVSAADESIPESGQTPLHFAMACVPTDCQAFKEIFLMLVEFGADVNALDVHHRSPLSYAAERGYLEGIQLLLAQGATFEYEEIHKAVLSDSMAGLDLLISYSGTPIDGIIDEGFHLLHTAVDEHNPACIEWLLAKGADPNVGFEGDEGEAGSWTFGCTPLLRAVVQGNEKIAEILLASGADVEQADSWDNTPVGSSKIVKILEVLINHGADVNRPLKSGALPITWAASTRDLARAKLLVTKGVNPNTRDLNGNCSMCISASLCNTVMVEWLCSIGANINRTNSDGRTALHCASNVKWLWDSAERAAGTKNLIELLIKRGIDIHAQDKQGRTALHLLARRGDADSVQYLLDARARFNVRDKFGLSPLCYAVGSRYQNTEALIKHGADVNVVTLSGQRPLTLATMKCAVNTMEMLFLKMRDKSKVVEPDALGRIALFYAVMTGHLETCQTAINQLPKKNECPRDIYGTTPAMIAARNGYRDILHLLLNNVDCQIDVPDNEGLTLLHWAVLGGSDLVWDLIASHFGTSVDKGLFLTDYLEPQVEVVFKPDVCHCTVCGQSTAHPPLSRDAKTCRLCKIGTRRFLLCLSCQQKGIKCLDDSHAWDDQTACCKSHEL